MGNESNEDTASTNERSRWQGGLDNTDWSKTRVKFASKWIKSGSKVADLGCGTQILAYSIDASCEYTGFDIGKMNSKNILIDLNVDFDLGGVFDTAILLGVLEYLQDPFGTLESLNSKVDELIISYVFSKNSNPKTIDKRTAIGVLNHFNEKEFLSRLGSLGLSVLEKEVIWNREEDKHVIFYLEWR